MSRRATAIALATFLSFGGFGCATTTTPRPASPPSGDAALEDVVAPLKADPAYVVRLSVPRPAEWAIQRNLQTPPGNPDIAYRLIHRETRGEIDLMFVPPVRPADLASRLRSGLGRGFTPSGGLDTSPSGDRSGFAAQGVRDGAPVVSRLVVLRTQAMTDATLIVAAEWPASADARLRRALDAIVGSMRAVPIGPPEPRTDLAMCLTRRGFRYYGASWCGFCQEQERMFGPGYSRLRAVDCSPPEAEGSRIAECADAGITTYPTWVLPDGTTLTGVRTLDALATASGCPWTPPSGE